MMTQTLYPDFLENFDHYQEVERFWQDFFEAIVSEKEWSWRPWMTPVFSDGTPFFDGNPIFNAYVPEADRGIRILQTDPEDADEFDYYFDTVELEDGQTFPELVISLVLTEDTKEKAEEAIRQWLDGELPEVPSSFLENYELGDENR
jgi:hypothetical protein